MPDDESLLRELNAKIGNAESAGDKAYLAGVIAPKLAFRRVSGVCHDRDGFLAAVANSPERRTEIESIRLLGLNRAFVTCIVTQEGKRFHNARLFIRDTDGQWKLLGWANDAA